MKLTQDQKNQRLCEWRGWKPLEGKHHPEIVNAGCMISPKGGLRVPPNHFTSLDAVHERYADELISLIHEVDPGYFTKMTWPLAGELLTATAAQRAEALGLTLGLWKEGE
jgi:hypothetical protein